MAIFKSNQIRNVALVGHGGDGKTALAEAMLYLAKVTDRLGKSADGNTVCDYDPEEIKRSISISASLANFEWKNTKINILDTPGYFDFEGEVRQAIRVADSAIIVVDGKSGHKVGTELAWELAQGKSRAFFINKLDDENSNFRKALKGLDETFGKSVCPVIVPATEGGNPKIFYNFLTDEAIEFDAKGEIKASTLPAGANDLIEEYRLIFTEAIAETDDELMMKYFEGEAFTHEETKNALLKGLVDGSIAPVFSGSSTTLAGVKALMDSIANFFCSPADKMKESVENADGTISEISANENGAPDLFIFKTVADKDVGKRSFFRVMNGNLTLPAVLTNSTTGQSEKIASIYTFVGKKTSNVETLCYGDIGATVKLANTNVNDTLSSSNVKYAKIKFPTPYYCQAIVPKAKGDEDKISAGISKILEEDYTLKYENNAETKQMCIYGMGNMHIDIMVSKLKNRFGASVDTVTAKVAYRETIKRKAQAEGKHKKQSGGHGQYGHVKIEFSPGASEGLEFTESIFGGSVPKNFHPAVEKGLLEAMQKGILAGYPVINIHANLFDGSYHDVDSSEMSFKLAAILAFKDGIPKADPAILEPIGVLKVLTPDSLMGDIIGDVNKRRGRISGTEQSSEKKGYTIVEAEVPTAEMSDYAIQLRAMTQGRGTFTFEFVKYEEAPGPVKMKIIEEAKANAQDE
ncbi:MAG: elongation factor G [Ruminococcaceae bacterium]|nr:elongation factor G [Oscillospiraceae bacterium]